MVQVYGCESRGVSMLRGMFANVFHPPSSLCPDSEPSAGEGYGESRGHENSGAWRASFGGIDMINDKFVLT